MKLTVTLLLVACTRPDATPPCDELNSYAPKGVSLGSNDAQCSELLEFAKTVPARYNMDFRSWLQVVPKQTVQFLNDSINSLSLYTTWPPTSFGPEPAQVPCGGTPTTDTLWNGSNLSKILQARPSMLYASLSIAIDGNLATVHVLQDFNCDGTQGTTELVGHFQQGESPLAGGWSLVRSSVAPLDQ
jgi:hypothetical protein